jgi:hypothetical protein
MPLQNIWLSLNYTALQPRKPYFSNHCYENLKSNKRPVVPHSLKYLHFDHYSYNTKINFNSKHGDIMSFENPAATAKGMEGNKYTEVNEKYPATEKTLDSLHSYATELL